jgi:hypothetical protein
MSLKIFHICFILLSTVLAAGSAVWAFREAASLVLGWVCTTFAVIMPIYGVWFLRKTRKLIL